MVCWFSEAYFPKNAQKKLLNVQSSVLYNPKVLLLVPQ